MSDYLKKVEKFVGRWWYPYLIAFLAFIDFFILVIPTDPLLVSAVVGDRKRWKRTVFLVATASAIGAWGMAYGVAYYSDPFLNLLGIERGEGKVWTDVAGWIHEYGYFAIFLLAAGPLPLHIGMIIGALVHMPLFDLFLVSWAGRVSKYGLEALIALKAPYLFDKIWGMKKLTEEVKREPEK